LPQRCVFTINNGQTFVHPVGKWPEGRDVANYTWGFQKRSYPLFLFYIQ
jgi:hypothetical protein